LKHLYLVPKITETVRTVPGDVCETR